MNYCEEENDSSYKKNIYIYIYIIIYIFIPFGD